MKLDMKWILLGAVALLLFSMQGTLPKESVEAIDGQACSVSADCPCWGTYNVTTIPDSTAFGLGVGRCVESACDMTYCLDVQPVGEWVRDNPWNWLRENPVAAIAIIALILGLIFWPK